jgi:hypothetical protein
MGGIELLENSILNSVCRNYDIHKYKSSNKRSDFLDSFHIGYPGRRLVDAPGVSGRAVVERFTTVSKCFNEYVVTPLECVCTPATRSVHRQIQSR